MEMIRHLTENMTGETARCILQFLGERKLPTRKAEMAKLLNRIWMQEPRRLLDALSPAERLLLAECAHGSGGEVDVAGVNAKHGLSYWLPDPCAYREHHVVLCFVWRDRFQDGLPRLVDGVAARLRELLPPPPKMQIRSEEKDPAEGVWTFRGWNGDAREKRRSLNLHMSEAVAPPEARRMLQLAASGKLRVSEATGWPSEATRKIVLAALCAPELDLKLPAGERPPYDPRDAHPDGGRAAAWPVLLQQCGWAKAKAGKLDLTAKGRDLLGSFSFDRYAEGVRTFVGDGNFDELRRVTLLKGQTGKLNRRWAIAPPVRRGCVMESLRHLPQGRWVELDEAHRVLLAVAGKGRELITGTGLYVGDPQYGSLSGAGLGFGRIYYRQLVGEMLATLGLVDLAYAYPHLLNPELYDSWGMDDAVYTTAFDGLKYVRVTPLGRYVLGMDRDYAPPRQEARALFKVLPNFDVVVLDAGAFSPADAATLERIADRKSDAVWQIVPRKILDALEEGDRPEDVLGALESGSGAAVPATVRRLVEETAARAGAATGREEAAIVSFRDEATAALVAHDRAAGKAVVCRDGASVVVRAKNLKAFQSALKNLGILLP